MLSGSAEPKWKIPKCWHDPIRYNAEIIPAMISSANNYSLRFSSEICLCGFLVKMAHLLGNRSFCLIILHAAALKLFHSILSIAVPKAMGAIGKTKFPLTGSGKTLAPCPATANIIMLRVVHSSIGNLFGSARRFASRRSARCFDIMTSRTNPPFPSTV